MAGRPRKMYRSASKCMRQVLLLSADLQSICPDKYKRSTDAAGTLHAAWKGALDAASQSEDAMCKLMDALGKKLPDVATAVAIDWEVYGDLCADCNCVVPVIPGKCPKCGYEKVIPLGMSAPHYPHDEKAIDESDTEDTEGGEDSDEPTDIDEVGGDRSCPDCGEMVAVIPGDCPACGYFTQTVG